MATVSELASHLKGLMIVLQSYLREATSERYRVNVEDARTSFAELLARTRHPRKARWYELARTEFEQAMERLAAGDPDAARKLLQEAEDHLRDAGRGRTQAATFIASPDGVITANPGAPLDPRWWDPEEREADEKHPP